MPRDWKDVDAPPDNMAVDAEGRALAHSPEEVRAICVRMIEEGEILAVIARVHDDLAVQVFGPPSQELLDCLDRATQAYRRVLAGH